MYLSSLKLTFGDIFFCAKELKMRNIRITDKTFSCLAGELSFREKTEIAKQLDKLGADVIELPVMKNEKADLLLIKNIASVVEKSALSVTAGFTKESVEAAFSCIKDAKRPVINIALPVSPAQMEYMCALKPDKLLQRIEELYALTYRNIGIYGSMEQ